MTGDTDTCGHETPTGPCQNPATEGDHCWIESHGGDVSGHGRPSKQDDAWDDIMAAAAEGLTLEGIARVAGVGVSTLREWRNDSDDFSAALGRARAQGERRLIGDADPEFVLERSYGYTKSQEVEHSGEVDLLSLSAEEKEQLDDLFDREVQGQ